MKATESDRQGFAKTMVGFQVAVIMIMALAIVPAFWLESPVRYVLAIVTGAAFLTAQLRINMDQVLGNITLGRSRFWRLAVLAAAAAVIWWLSR